MTEDIKPVAPLRVRRKNERRLFTPQEEEQIRETYAYDPETGVFTWKKCKKRSRMKIGDVAGSMVPNGFGANYWQLFFNNTSLRAHRVAFFLMKGRWPLPGMEIDHRDNNPLNNKFDNLREATKTQNIANRKKYINNKSGYKGVTFYGKRKARKPFQAHIKTDGRNYSLGTYFTAQEASEAYLSAALFLHGEFANLD